MRCFLLLTVLPACTACLRHSLINNEDKDYFKKMLAELVNKHGLGASYDDLFVNRAIMFGDFLRMGVDREERKCVELFLFFLLLFLSCGRDVAGA